MDTSKAGYDTGRHGRFTWSGAVRRLRSARLTLCRQFRPSPCPTHYGGRSAVGSEEARLRAGLRPPLKLHVRFSRMQLSRRCMVASRNRRNQSHKIYQPQLAIELSSW